MNGYVCFYENKRWETYSPSLADAKDKALAYFKPAKSKRHMVHCHLAEKDGETITRIAVD